MMKLLKTGPSPCALLLLLLSCGPRGGTDVGNGATVSFNLKGYEPPAGSGGGSQSQAVRLESGVEIDEAWVAVESFRLRPADTCSGGGDGEIDFAGPSTANLLGLGILDRQPIFEVPAGDYCRLRLDLHALKGAELPAGAPAELEDHSFLMRGRRADGVAFSARTNVKLDYRLDAKNTTFRIEEGSDDFIIGFNLAELVEALDLDSFAGPNIVIDKQSAPATVEKLDQSLRAAAKLFRDENADGELSQGEASSAKEIADDKP